MSQGIYCFGVSVFGGSLIDPAPFNFLPVGDGDCLRRSGGDSVCPDTIMIANASHAIRLTYFKFFHFSLPSFRVFVVPYVYIIHYKVYNVK